MQNDGTFIASNLKQFGIKVESLANQKNPSSVYLKERSGNISTKVEKVDNIYFVTKYSNNKPTRRDMIKEKTFEYNYRHHI